MIELRPRHSVWARIVFDLSPRSCLPIRLRYFERGKASATKEAAVDPRGHLRHGDIWVAHNAVMRDLANDTTTDLMVDSRAQAALLPEAQFTVEGLERAVRGAVQPTPGIRAPVLHARPTEVVGAVRPR